MKQDLRVGQCWGMFTEDGELAFSLELLAEHPKKANKWIMEPTWSALAHDSRMGKVDTIDTYYLQKFFKPMPEKAC